MWPIVTDIPCFLSVSVGVCVSCLSVCLLDITMTCAKTAEPTEMPFGFGHGWAQETVYSVWVGIPQGMGSLRGDMSRPIEDRISGVS